MNQAIASTAQTALVTGRSTVPFWPTAYQPARRSNRRVFFGVGGMAIALLLALGVVLGGGRHKKAELSPAPAPAVQSSVVRATVAAPLTLRGPMVAGSRLRLGFKAAGIVGSVVVKEGDFVRKGQLLARLDNGDANARTRSAQVVAEQARRDWQRSVRLADDGAVAVGTRDDAKSRFESAAAMLAIAADGLKGTQLTSPVQGTVFKRLAEPGETVAAGTPVLIVEETQRPVVKLGVTGRELGRIRKGQAAVLIAEDGAREDATVSTISATPDAADGLYAVEVVPTRPGAVSLVAAPPAAGPKVGSKPQKAGAGAPSATTGDEHIRLGALVTVLLEASTEQVTRIPLAALVHRNDKDMVFVVEGGAAPVARAKVITVGRSEGQEIAVLSGLQDGERIVTEGAYFLVDGQAVRIVN